MADTQIWQTVPLAPPDAIFKITAGYKADTDPKKVNLGVGAYRDNNGKPWVLPVVKKATERLLNDSTLDHEYLPITGLPEFITAAAKLIIGADAAAIKEGRVASAQTISGTGANHLGALFLSRFYQFNGDKRIYLSDPTWANHHAIFRNVGIEPVNYKYYDPRTVGLDFEGFLDALNSAPERSVFLLHACAHNPTGVDPTTEQWTAIADVMLQRGHYAFFDCAYQGFASGDLDRDAGAVRYFETRQIPMMVCQSFAKNAGLYGERIGALHLVAESADAGARVRSQMSVLQRSEISNPPAHGARLMALIMNESALFEEWKRDIATMALRIIDMREQLFKILSEELKTPGTWDHIVKQIGMFSFTGLNASQSQTMTDKYHIYLTTNGRISMAGLNTNNVRYVAECIDKVVRGEAKL
ncbi:aspartate aminotransferase [Auriculariales sp. MPI-PUGE-AT-0066]|nr:aspartate aminotransferase [Auriculariales sp. MPI-PUGE-AT-0066]